MPSPADEVRLRFNHVIALLAPTARGSGPVDWPLALHAFAAHLFRLMLVSFRHD